MKKLKKPIYSNKINQINPKLLSKKTEKIDLIKNQSISIFHYLHHHIGKDLSMDKYRIEAL